ncbi:hypothetical protein BGW80DRAFT_1252123 [Lactifluus volemus]|nr:hypothetical protein BGW80DRAFT_1252123 [Lactifluus volemus]
MEKCEKGLSIELTARICQQYVCAGELVTLQTLTNVLNYLKLTEKFGLTKVKDMLKDIVNNCYDHALEKQKAEGYIVLECGLATIPLAGIDAPFHSRYLWSGVIPFRALTLQTYREIPSTLLDPSLLEGVYIPNSIASPFAVNKVYAELIYNRTSSPRLSKVLPKWDEEHWDAPEQRQKFARVLLVELLSYQFASPLRWIETQNLFFGQYRFERFIEIGPSLTLTGMAVRTLKAKYEAKDDLTSVVRRVFCALKHQKEIYYQFENDLEVTSEPDAASETAPPAPTPLPSVPVAVATATPAAAGPAVTIEDTPIRAVDILAAIFSQKLKKKLSEIPLSKSIRDLSAAAQVYAQRVGITLSTGGSTSGAGGSSGSAVMNSEEFLKFQAEQY